MGRPIVTKGVPKLYQHPPNDELITPKNYYPKPVPHDLRPIVPSNVVITRQPVFTPSTPAVLAPPQAPNPYFRFDQYGNLLNGGIRGNKKHKKNNKGKIRTRRKKNKSKKNKKNKSKKHKKIKNYS